MKNARRVIILVALISGFIALGRLLPKIDRIPGLDRILKRPAENAVSHRDKSSPPSGNSRQSDGDNDWRKAAADSLFRLFSSTPALQCSPDSSKWLLDVPCGKSLEEYAFIFAGICRARDIAVIRGEEVKSKVQQVEIFTEKNSISCRFRIRHGRATLPGSKKVAVVFSGLDDFTQNDFVLLSGAGWKKSLIINPYTENRKLFSFAREITGDEVLISLPMEPFHYPYSKPGKNALFIHHSSKKVGALLKEKLSCLPRAAGFATSSGGRAIENEGLLEKLFSFLAAKNLVFLDLTDSQRSLSQKVSRDAGIKCKQAVEITGGTQTASLLEKKIVSAGRYGEALIVLEYSPATFKAVHDFISSRNWAVTGLEFCFFSELDMY